MRLRASARIVRARAGGPIGVSARIPEAFVPVLRPVLTRRKSAIGARAAPNLWSGQGWNSRTLDCSRAPRASGPRSASGTRVPGMPSGAPGCGAGCPAPRGEGSLFSLLPHPQLCHILPFLVRLSGWGLFGLTGIVRMAGSQPQARFLFSGRMRVRILGCGVLSVCPARPSFFRA